MISVYFNVILLYAIYREATYIKMVTLFKKLFEFMTLSRTTCKLVMKTTSNSVFHAKNNLQNESNCVRRMPQRDKFIKWCYTESTIEKGHLRISLCADFVNFAISFYVTTLYIRFMKSRFHLAVELQWLLSNITMVFGTWPMLSWYLKQRKWRNGEINLVASTLGVGVTKPISSVPLFFLIFHHSQNKR